MKDILIYPDINLKTPAEPVDAVDAELQSLIDEMIETMYAAPGVGLAANQIGVLKRLAVMDVTAAEKGPQPIVLINPRITAWEAEETAEEGCLSVPEYTAPVKRAACVEVVGYDRDGHEITFQADGLLARCVQHELDHLGGICFVERLSPIRRALFRRRWAKLRPTDP